MKAFLSIIIIVSCFSIIKAQSVFIRLDEEQKTCIETGSEYQGIDNWEIFQTDNNLVSGEKTIVCAEYSLYDRTIELDEIVEEKTFFIENIEPFNSEISGNTIYSFSTTIIGSEDVLCSCSDDCSQDICNEITVILKGESNGITLRDTLNVMTSSLSNSNGVDRINFDACFVTPPYDNIVIEKITFTIFAQEIDSLSFISIFGITFEDVEESNFYFDDGTFINHVIPDQFRLGISYVVRPTFFTEFQEEFYFGHIKVLNPQLSDPSITERFYYDLTPEDSTQQKIINIINSSFSQLVFQKNAQLRGALVAIPDNDTLRHRLNIVNDGADMCLPAFIELILGGEDEFRFRSGSLHFSNNWSCLQFRENAKLIVEEGALFHYGNKGIGLLSLRPGASIQIDDNASLYFDGELIMPDNNESPITLRLSPNQSLEFSPSSKIRTYQPDAKLSIYMEGGNLDISQLQPKYHKYLDIIYPEQLTDNPKSIVLYPNPASDALTIYVEQEYIGSTISIYNQTGNCVLKEIRLESRLNDVDISRLNSGIYFVKHDTGDVSRLVVK